MEMQDLKSKKSALIDWVTNIDNPETLECLEYLKCLDSRNKSLDNDIVFTAFAAPCEEMTKSMQKRKTSQAYLHKYLSYQKKCK